MQRPVSQLAPGSGFEAGQPSPCDADDPLSVEPLDVAVLDDAVLDAAELVLDAWAEEGLPLEAIVAVDSAADEEVSCGEDDDASAEVVDSVPRDGLDADASELVSSVSVVAVDVRSEATLVAASPAPPSPLPPSSSSHPASESAAVRAAIQTAARGAMGHRETIVMWTPSP